MFSPDSMTRTIAAPTSEVEAALGEALDWQLGKLTGSQAAASPVQSLVTLEVQSDTLDLDLDTKEDYELRVRCHEDATNINIVAETYFGARHALETLFQLVFYDSLSLSFLLSCDVAISDGPFYRHRGVMLDTARSVHLQWQYYITDTCLVLQKLRVSGHDQDADRLAELLQAERAPLAPDRHAELPSLPGLPPDVRRVRSLQPRDDVQQGAPHSYL